MYTYKATIINVYDADTVTAVLDLGIHVSVQIKVRLKGINAPEIHGYQREKGLLSKARMQELVLGKQVVIKTYKDRQEKYGRWLGEIFLSETDTKSVNQMLIDEGFAWEYHH